tara:strand:+ start:375 stop:659 length:285 start_codon:yes stop_codon:yes gene_type:complete
MAQHIPIGQSGFDNVIGKIIKREDILKLEDFKRVYNDELSCYMQKLPTSEYQMNEEHGKKDDLVVYFYKLDVDDYSYEVHIDKDTKVNQVYLVL